MPEMTFTVEWPDGYRERCYSPSLVVHDHLQVGRDYPVGEFVERSRTALTLASDRVRARYGMVCTSALEQIARIEQRAATLPEGVDGSVRVLGMEPELPRPVQGTLPAAGTVPPAPPPTAAPSGAGR